MSSTFLLFFVGYGIFVSTWELDINLKRLDAYRTSSPSSDQVQVSLEAIRDKKELGYKKNLFQIGKKILIQYSGELGFDLKLIFFKLLAADPTKPNKYFIDVREISLEEEFYRPIQGIYGNYYSSFEIVLSLQKGDQFYSRKIKSIGKYSGYCFTKAYCYELALDDSIREMAKKIQRMERDLP